MNFFNRSAHSPVEKAAFYRSLQLQNKSLESERYMGGFAYGLKDVFVGVGWRNKMLNWRLSTTEIVECIYRDKRNERKVAHFKFVAKKEKQKWTELEISFQRKFPLFLLNILPPTSRQQAHVYILIKDYHASINLPQGISPSNRIYSERFHLTYFLSRSVARRQILIKLFWSFNIHSCVNKLLETCVVCIVIFEAEICKTSLWWLSDGPT